MPKVVQVMFRIVLLQGLAMLVVAVIAALLGGVPAMISALLGGLAAVVPNALFAWRLALQAKSPQGATVGSFFVGEMLKLAMTVAVLVAAALFYRELNWLALLAGLIVALKAYFAAFLIDRHR